MTIDSMTVARLANVTYRQLDYWVSKGYVNTDDQHPGSGNERRFMPHEAAMAIALATLIRVGFRPDVAAREVRRA